MFGFLSRLFLMFLGVEDDPVVLLLEPLHGVILDQLVGGPDAAGLLPENHERKQEQLLIGDIGFRGGAEKVGG